MSNGRALAWGAYWLMWALCCAVLVCRTVPSNASRSASYHPSALSVSILTPTGSASLDGADAASYAEQLGDRLERWIAAHLTPDGKASGLSQRTALVIVLIAVAGWWLGALVAGAGGTGLAIGAILYILLLRSHLMTDGYRWGMIFAPLVAGGLMAGGAHLRTGTIIAAAAILCWSALEPLGGLALLAAVGWAAGRLVERRSVGGAPAAGMGAGERERVAPGPVLLVCAITLVLGAFLFGWPGWLELVATPLAARKFTVLEPLGLISPQVAGSREGAALLGAVLLCAAASSRRRGSLPLGDAVLSGTALASMLVARGSGPLFYAVATVLLAREADTLLPGFAGGRYRGARAFIPLVPMFCAAPLIFRTPLCDTAHSLQSEAFKMMPLLQEVRIPGSLRLFNDQRAAEALVFAGLPVFMDPRVPVFTMRRSGAEGRPTVADDYTTIIKLLPGWKEAFARWRFNGALVRRESSLAAILIDEGWTEQAISASVRIVDRGRADTAMWVLLIAPPG